MGRFVCVAVLAALVCPTFAGQGPQFEVASIKKNTTNQASWDLVFARSDHRLGSQIKPSALDCSQPFAPSRPAPGTDMKQMAMSSCSNFVTDRDGTMYSGGSTMASLIRMITPAAGRTIVDRSGLEGFYSVAFRFQQIPRQNLTPSPDDPPNVFTAVQEQLGLKLESSKTQAQVVVIDHIERFSEN